MTFWPETLLQVFINRYKVHPIIEWNKNPGDDQIAQEIPQYNLHITKLSTANPARDRNKGDP